VIAGLPGAGISALFYLIAVALMPFVGLWRALRGDHRAPGQWRLVVRQLVIATGIVVVLFAAGWVVSMVVPQLAVPGGGGNSVSVSQIAIETGMAFARIGLVAGLVTLMLVLGTVRVIALLDRSRRRSHAATVSTKPSVRK
jgi:hypothetical protein